MQSLLRRFRVELPGGQNGNQLAFEIEILDRGHTGGLVTGLIDLDLEPDTRDADGLTRVHGTPDAVSMVLNWSPPEGM